jgi:hypothetical protein
VAQTAPGSISTLPTDFIAFLDELPAMPDLGHWLTGASLAAYEAWTKAALEAYDLPNGMALLSHDVPLAFRYALNVRMGRKCSADDTNGGGTFFPFLFSVPHSLEVVVWLEDDTNHALLAYRGDASLLHRIASDMRRLEGRCFAGSVGPKEPYQHIIRVPR